MGKVCTAIVGISILLSAALTARAFTTPLAPSPQAASAPATVRVPQKAAPGTPAIKGAKSQPKPMTDIHDIKPLVTIPVPVPIAVIALWVGVAVAAAALLLGGWLFWKRRRKRQLATVTAALSPEETARSRLDALATDAAADGKAFYFQLSSILREYIQGRFGIDGLEMTTEELLPQVDVLAIDRGLKRETKRFIVACDPVKFAGAPTYRPAMENDHEFVRNFVEKTAAPVPDPSDTSDPASPGPSE